MPHAEVILLGLARRTARKSRKYHYFTPARGVVDGAARAAEHDAVARAVVTLELDARAGVWELVALALALGQGELVAAPLPRVLVAVLLRVDDAAVAVGDAPAVVRPEVDG